MSVDRGERGPTGDHGQDGQDGAAGPQGRIGERGRSSELTRKQVLSLFLTMMLFFGLFAYRSERQATDLRRTTMEMRTGVYEQCQLNSQNARDTGRFIDSIIETVRLRPDLSDERKASLVAAYRDTKPRVLHCGLPPR